MCPPYVCIGKPRICNDLRPRSTWVGVAKRTRELLMYARELMHLVCQTFKVCIGFPYQVLKLYKQVSQVALTTS